MKNTTLKIISTCDLNNYIQIAQKLTKVKEEMKTIKTREAFLVNSLKNYMMETKIKDFENFKLIEKSKSEVLPSEYYKFVSHNEFIQSVSVIKKEAKKYIGSEKLKEIGIKLESTYDLKMKV